MNTKNTPTREPNTRLNKMNQSPVLRRSELPAYLKISMPTVDRLLRDGVLPKIQITQKLVGVLKTDIDAYLSKNKTQ